MVADMSAKLLDLLRRHRGRWVGCESLQITLGLLPVDVHREIQQFQEMGHEIELSPIYGYRLLAGTGTFNTDQIEFGLETRRVGRKILVYESTSSTNDVAWRHRNETGYDGLVVFAHHQNCGRGRLGRHWLSKPGQSLLCSVLLQKELRLKGAVLSLVAGVAAAQTIEQCQGLSVRIKWPNDILVEGRKLAGIMVEARRSGNDTDYVIGLGINSHQLAEDFDPEVRETATSLMQLSGKGIDNIDLAQTLLKRLDSWISTVTNGDTESLRQTWLSRCDQLGRRLSVLRDGQDFTGRVIDVQPDTGLILQLDDGAISILDAATTSTIS